MTRTYKHTPAGGGGPMGAGAIPTSMQPRPGLVRVPVRRKGVQQVYEPEPEIEDEVPVDYVEMETLEHAAEQIERVHNSTAYFPQSEQVLAVCVVCAATESTDVLVTIAKVNEISVCGSCVERLMEATRAELPRRRLRLAMERLAAGAVSLDVVEQIEKLAAGQYPVKTDE